MTNEAQVRIRDLIRKHEEMATRWKRLLCALNADVGHGSEPERDKNHPRLKRLGRGPLSGY